MIEGQSQAIEQSLAAPDIHDEWEDRYRKADIRAFQQQSLAHVIETARPAPGSTFLDAGCGSGFNAIQLAELGHPVIAVDFSDAVLDRTRANVDAAGMGGRVRVQRENLLELSLPDEGADHVLCWGVLMHIPEIDRAIDQLVRVVKPGGSLIVVEGNLHAIDELVLRLLDVLGRTDSRERVPAGMERWRPTPAGPLFARRADIGWLVRAFARRGLALRERVPCQFTEAYVYLPDGLARRAVNALNRFWFRRVRSGRLASSNFLVFQKPL
jgi:SAM-dependent methyltransferase